MIIAWTGFAGAWLLVAGPLYQGSLELLEQQIDQAGFEAVTKGLPAPPMPSMWWWLLPPVMIALQQRRMKAYRQAALALLTAEQRTQYAGFVRKATGWFVVATGASLLAIKETWELCERLEWPVWVFVTILVVMFILAWLTTAYGMTNKRFTATDL